MDTITHTYIFFFRSLGRLLMAAPNAGEFPATGEGADKLGSRRRSFLRSLFCDEEEEEDLLSLSFLPTYIGRSE